MRLLITAAAMAAASLVTSADAGAVELTMSNFDEQTGGKNSFVKFLAPW